MPNASDLATFLAARSSGKTNIAKTLDALFATPGQHGPGSATFPLANWLSQKRVLHAPLPDSAPNNVRGFLKNPAAVLGAATPVPALGDPELDHIDDWPKNQKEQVRRKLVEAIDGNRPVEFFWKLHSGDSEVTDIEDPGAPGTTITITFRSPWKNVKLWSANHVTVNVGS